MPIKIWPQLPLIKYFIIRFYFENCMYMFFKWIQRHLKENDGRNRNNNGCQLSVGRNLWVARCKQVYYCSLFTLTCFLLELYIKSKFIYFSTRKHMVASKVSAASRGCHHLNSCLPLWTTVRKRDGMRALLWVVKKNMMEYN